MVKAIGVDIGGTGIKAGVVDLVRGELDSAHVRVPTPPGAAPADVLTTVRGVLATLGVTESALPLGVAFPSVVKSGKTLYAANISPEWIDFDAAAFFEDGLGRDITFVNDADAAGVAEARHGAARGAKGLAILATFGTGIGSAFLYDGHLLPNTELGHLDHCGEPIEHWAAYSAKERDQLDWGAWAARAQVFFARVERVFSPDLFIVGGGASKHPEQFLPLLDLRAPVVPAVHRNAAGIIGAACLAAD